MQTFDFVKILDCAIEAAQLAGNLMRRHQLSPKVPTSVEHHDIKLELDLRCQERIERHLRRAYPTIPILGEEGVTGDAAEPYRWVVDPIDGTVNYAQGIPHCCTSIAFQGPNPQVHFVPRRKRDFSTQESESRQTLVGVVYDPFAKEMWTAIAGRSARLNGKPIKVSTCGKISESILSMGFAKSSSTLRRMLPVLNYLIPRARKTRMMGAAALALAYVASGRFDGFMEYGIRLWDIAAGGLLVQCAGGDYRVRNVPGILTYHVVAANGKLGQPLQLAQFKRDLK